MSMLNNGPHQIIILSFFDSSDVVFQVFPQYRPANALLLRLHLCKHLLHFFVVELFHRLELPPRHAPVLDDVVDHPVLLVPVHGLVLYVEELPVFLAG